jgi:ATP-dependent DNA helicase RecQ
MRKELVYDVYLETNANNVHKAILQQLYENWTSVEEGRGLVFCLYTSETQELCEFLNKEFDQTICGYYHGKLKADQKKLMYDDWISGKTKIMVATKAFGVDIDFAKIRLVIHNGHSASLLDYAQETGRAGRDGNRSRCITIFNERNCQRFIDLQQNEEKTEDVQRMCNFLKVQFIMQNAKGVIVVSQT